MTRLAGSLLMALIVGAGCGSSSYALKREASDRFKCPLDRVHIKYHQGASAVVEVCGTDRRFWYGSQGSEGWLQTHSPTQWFVVGEEIPAGFYFSHFRTDPVLQKLLQDMWGSSAQDVWAVGGGGAIFRFDGTAWKAFPCEENSHHFGVWGADSGAVWVAGSGGSLLHWDGESMGKVSLSTKISLFGVGGTSRKDVWAVGQGGAIYHRDASGWHPVTIPVTQSLHRVWAASPMAAWIVGEKGTLLHWNGTAWQREQLGTTSDLTTVWGSSQRDVWVGGSSGQVFRWDGGAWHQVRLYSYDEYGEENCVNQILGFGPRDVWVIGCQVHHFDGKRWRRLDLVEGKSDPDRAYFKAAWGTSSSDILFVEAWNHAAQHWNGKQWRLRPWPVGPCGQPARPADLDHKHY